MNKSRKIATALIVSALMVASSGLTIFAEPAPAETTITEGAAPIEAVDEAPAPIEAISVDEETDNELTEIDAGAVLTEGDFQYEVISKTNSVKIKKYVGTDTIVTIPDTIDNYPVTEIAGNAFARTSVTSITVGNNVATIAANAFAGATTLETVNLPNSVSSIGNSAFSGCTSLTTVNIPSNVATIPASCFANCTSLSSITIPDSITKISSKAFLNCTSLSDSVITFASREGLEIDGTAFEGCTNAVVFSYVYDITGKRIAITGVSTGADNITIPAEIDGLPVIKIADGAFKNNAKLVTVTIEEGDEVMTLGKEVFFGAKKLENVYLSSKVTEISEAAFKGCTSLKKVPLTNSIVKIGKEAFSGCTTISEVIFPSSVTKILAKSFQGCTGIKTVTMTKEVIEVGEEAFRGCTGLEILTLSSGMTTIEKGTFAQCTSLLAVTFPESITTIADGKSTSGKTPTGDGAFSDCESLKSLTFHKKFKKIGACAFSDCFGIETISLNEGLTEIGSLAFSGNILLDNVVIPTSVTTLNAGTFSCCTSLKSITVPPSVTTLKGSTSFNTGSKRNDGVFGYCTSLEEISLPGVTDIGAYALSECENLTKVTLEDKFITNIGNYAFAHSTSLKGITLPNSIEYIGKGAFKGCSSLESIVIPTNSELTKIESDTFAQCSSLTDVTIPENITTIVNGTKADNKTEKSQVLYDGAFSNCTSLESIKLPKTLSIIGKMTFAGCHALKSITIPDSVSTISDYAFFDCRALTNVKLGKTLKSIGKYAFENCITLPEIKIPASVTSIDDGAFSSCDVLTKLTVESNVLVKNFYNKVFLTNSKECDLVQPVIKDNLQEIIMLNGVTTIEENAFGDAEHLKKVEFSGTTKTIGKGAFFHCTTLEVISTIPKSVTTIGEEAFNGCTNLKSVVIPSTVETIGSNAFSGCTGITIYGKTGSAADNYCKEDAHPFVNIYFSTNVTSKQLSNGHIQLSWNKSPLSNVVYYIYRSEDSDSLDKIGETTGLTYTDTTAVKGGSYTYYVACYDKDNDIVTDPSAPVTVTGIKVTVASTSSKKVTLSWGAVNGATGYIVKSADGKTQYTKTIKTTSYTVTGLTNGEKHSFKVYAYINGKWYGSATVSATPTGAPQNVKAVRASKSVPLSWDAVDGATGYLIKSADGKTQYTKTIKTNSYTVSGLTNGTTYKFKVYAYVDGKWFASSTKTMTPSGTPQNVTVSASNKSATIKWKAVNGATGYIIKSADGKTQYTSKSIKTNSYTVTGLTNGTSYKFKIYACVDGKWYTAKTSSVTPTGAPQNVKATAGSKSITLSWDAVNGATGYLIKSADGSTKYTKTIKTTSYTIKGLTAGKQYKFKVYAYVDGKWYASGTKSKTPKA